MCISNVQQMNGNSIEFFLLTQTRRVIKSPQAKSLHLLTSLCSSLSLAAPFGVSVCVPPYCTFSFVEHTTSLQFHYSLFLPTLYSGHKILLLFCSDTFLIITSLLPHFTYSTLVISSLFASSSLQFHASWHRLHHMFLTCLSRRNPCP